MDYNVVIPFWNQKHIPPPSPDSKKLPTSAVRKVSSLRSLLSVALSKLDKASVLHKEAAVLSRLIYRMKKIFRQDKGFKYLTMLLRALRNHLVLNVSEVVTTLRDGCYENSCPSKEMIEWGLVSIMRFASLFNRINSLTELTASTLQHRFSTGHYWKLSALCLGVIGRIWALAEFFVVKSCDWFAKLRTFLPITVSSGSEWLPSNFSIPSDLTTWLGNPSYLSKPASEMEGGSELGDLELRKLLKSEAIQDDVNLQPPKSQFDEVFKLSSVMDMDEDLGETVERDNNSDNKPSIKHPEKGVKRKEGKVKIHQKKKKKKVSE